MGLKRSRIHTSVGPFPNILGPQNISTTTDGQVILEAPKSHSEKRCLSSKAPLNKQLCRTQFQDWFIPTKIFQPFQKTTNIYYIYKDINLKSIYI